MEVGERSNGVRIVSVEMRVERRGERVFRKSLSVGPAAVKIEFHFIYRCAIETQFHCLKCGPSMFQKVCFKQLFLSNYFQTTLF